MHDAEAVWAVGDLDSEASGCRVQDPLVVPF